MPNQKPLPAVTLSCGKDQRESEREREKRRQQNRQQRKLKAETNGSFEADESKARNNNQELGRATKDEVHPTCPMLMLPQYEVASRVTVVGLRTCSS